MARLLSADRSPVRLRDYAWHGFQWAAILSAAAVYVAINGMPDTEFTGDDHDSENPGVQASEQ